MPMLLPDPVRQRLALGLVGPLLLAVGTAQSQDLAKPASTAWRCANGQYSDAPCPGGQALNVADPRSAEQQRQARDAAQRHAAMAQQMTAERQAREQAAARHPAPMAGIGPKPQPPAAAASAPAKRKKTRRDHDQATADDGHPAGPHRKTKAEKAADKARAAPGRQAQDGKLGQF